MPKDEGPHCIACPQGFGEEQEIRIGSKPEFKCRICGARWTYEDEEDSLKPHLLN